MQLSVMLESLLGNEDVISEELECYFLEALYCSLGATLLDKGQQKFDEFIKKLSSLNSVHDEKVLAGPGQIPGEVAAGSKMIFFAMLGNSGKLRKYKCFLPYLKPSA